MVATPPKPKGPGQDVKSKTPSQSIVQRAPKNARRDPESPLDATGDKREAMTVETASLHSSLPSAAPPRADPSVMPDASPDERKKAMAAKMRAALSQAKGLGDLKSGL